MGLEFRGEGERAFNSYWIGWWVLLMALKGGKRREKEEESGGLMYFDIYSGVH